MVAFKLLRARWRYGFLDGLTAGLIRVSMARRPETERLRSWDASRLVTFGRANSVAAGLLTGDYELGTAEEQIAVVTEPDTVSLVGFALRQARDIGVRSETLRKSVVDNRGAAGSNRVGAALIAIAGIAATLASIDAEAILRLSLELARTSVGPYRAGPEVSRVRAAAVAIMETHPELDGVPLELASQPGDRSTLELFAAALQRRPSDRSQAALNILEAVRPPLPAWRTFAELADARLESLPGVFPRPPRIPAPSATDFVFRLLAALSGIVLGLVVFTFAFDRNWPQLGVRIDLTVVFALLAVLVAAHVVATELAADRLPGPMARYTSLPNTLVAGYGTVAAMGAVAVTEGDHPWPAWGWVIVAVAIEFGIVVLLSMGQLIRRTDAAFVVELFERHQQTAAHSAGRYLGRLQRRAFETARSLGDFTFTRTTTTPARFERRLPIETRRRGFLFLRLGVIRRLAKSRKWAGGELRLFVAGGMGTILNEGEEVISVVPTFSVEATPWDRWRVGRALQTLRIRGVEDIAEWVAVSIQEAGRLAERGDVGGAQRASRAAQRLLQAHVREAHWAAKWQNGERPQVVAVVPALRVAMHSAVRVMASKWSSSKSDIICSFIEGIISETYSFDAATMLLATALRNSADDLDPALGGRVMKAAAIRCIETDNRVGLTEAIGELFRLSNRAGEVVPVVATDLGEVGASAAWLNYGLASEVWRRIWAVARRFSGSSAVAARDEIAVIVGSGALAAGVMSVALDVVLSWRAVGADIPRLANTFQRPATLARLGLISDMGGGCLGTEPRDAVANFCEFANRVAAAV